MARNSKRQEDYEAYLRRAEEIERRIAAGESIMDIMRSEQLERGKARIQEIMAQYAEDMADE